MNELRIATNTSSQLEGELRPLAVLDPPLPQSTRSVDVKPVLSAHRSRQREHDAQARSLRLTPPLRCDLTDDVVQLGELDSCENHAELFGCVVLNVEIVAEVVVVAVPALVIPHAIIQIQIGELQLLGLLQSFVKRGRKRRVFIPN